MTPRDIPRQLIHFRFGAGPGLLALVLAMGVQARVLCTALLAAGVLSDIFDGIIARRLGSSTPELRKLDSKADLVFWLCAALAALLMRPELVGPLLLPAGVLIALEFIAPVISIRRFGQEASTHHWLSKIFGLGLWLLLTVSFLAGEVRWLIYAIFVLGVASQLEAIAIMLTIPAWQSDIPHLGYALRLRARSRQSSA